MSVVARDGRKHIIRRGTAFAEVIQHYLASIDPANLSPEARAKKQRVLLRRVLAFVGRVVCELEFEELATALGFRSKGAVCRSVNVTRRALLKACGELNLDESALLASRAPAASGEADEDETPPRAGRRRSEWIRNMRKANPIQQADT